MEEEFVSDTTVALYNRMLAMNMTREDLSMATGLSLASISKVFAGRFIRLRDVAAIAYALGSRVTIKLEPIGCQPL